MQRQGLQKGCLVVLFPREADQLLHHLVKLAGQLTEILCRARNLFRDVVIDILIRGGTGDLRDRPIQLIEHVHATFHDTVAGGILAEHVFQGDPVRAFFQVDIGAIFGQIVLFVVP